MILSIAFITAMIDVEGDDALFIVTNTATIVWAIAGGTVATLSTMVVDTVRAFSSRLTTVITATHTPSSSFTWLASTLYSPLLC